MRIRNRRRGRRGAGGSLRQSMESGITLMRVHLCFLKDFRVCKHCNPSATRRYSLQPTNNLSSHRTSLNLLIPSRICTSRTREYPSMIPARPGRLRK